MKKVWIVSMSIMLALTACGAKPDRDTQKINTPDVDKEAPTIQVSHTHGEPEEDNVIGHDPVGYCGNTMTTVTYDPMGPDSESWTVSFAGSPSVELTDLLRYLNYNGGICRCLPEYTITTEFGENYGISLTEGYARYGDGQTDLTAEQIADIQSWIEEGKDQQSPAA